MLYALYHHLIGRVVPNLASCLLALFLSHFIKIATDIYPPGLPHVL